MGLGLTAMVSVLRPNAFKFDHFGDSFSTVMSVLVILGFLLLSVYLVFALRKVYKKK